MERAEVSRIVREQIAVVVGAEVDEITEATNLRSDFEVDSLEMMEIWARLEGELDIQFEVSELQAVTDVGSAVDLMQARL